MFAASEGKRAVPGTLWDVASRTLRRACDMYIPRSSAWIARFTCQLSPGAVPSGPVLPEIVSSASLRRLPLRRQSRQCRATIQNSGEFLSDRAGHECLLWLPVPGRFA